MRIHYLLRETFNSPKNIYLNVKWFVQRGIRGYADCDWWSLDRYLCKVTKDAIYTMLANGIQYKDTFTEVKDGFKLWEICEKKRLMWKIIDFFTLHELLMEHPMLWRLEQVRRLYRARGLLYLRNFGRLWD